MFGGSLYSLAEINRLCSDAHSKKKSQLFFGFKVFFLESFVARKILIGVLYEQAALVHPVLSSSYVAR